MSIQAIYTSATGMQAMETKLDVIANNMANMETTAFKRGRANFEDLMYRTETYPGLQDAASRYTAVGIQVGMGSRVESVQNDFKQGPIEKSGGELDVAIQGRGFFRVIDPSTNETLYTRSGNFSVNANGGLVIASASVGRLLDPQIQIPQDAMQIQISSDGNVLVQQPGNQQLQQVGKLELTQFINPEGLLKMGENLYKQTDASGQPQNGTPGLEGLGTLQQGFLEASNVEPVVELADLIKTQRAFEFNSQLIQASDQVLQAVVQLRRF